MVFSIIKNNIHYDIKKRNVESYDIKGKEIIFSKERIELKIEMSPRYRLTICTDSMHYLFKLFMEGEYLEDRKQYRWQKELIDMIEGG